MKLYDIYAGLQGILGGEKYIGTYQFEEESDALNAAYMEACEIYERYEGTRGIPSFSECYQTMIDSWHDEHGDNAEIDEAAVGNWAEELHKAEMEERIAFSVKLKEDNI